MKPFNIEEAKRGKPVMTYSEEEVTILTFDRKLTSYPIVALINISGIEIVYEYSKEGVPKQGSSHIHTLYMAPCPEVSLHVDDFVDFGTTYKNPPPGEKDARWFLLLKRLPANLQYAFEDKIKDLRLFCDFEGARYRCTGASRMGDVWLTSDYNQGTGYEKRVDVDKCSNWGSEA